MHMENAKLCVQSLDMLDFEKLMEVYQESNRENGEEFYPEETPERQIQLVQDEFRQFLETFFAGEGACYWVLMGNESYLSAFRLEPWRDGFLLEALETRPDFRQQGAAKRLIRSVLQELPCGTTIYSHVSRRNAASLRTHESCGFEEIPDRENPPHQVTMRFIKNRL